MSTMADTPTTVTVKTSTLSSLRRYKTPGATLDDVIVDLMAETPPETYWREIERRRAEPGPDVPASVVFRRAGLR